MTNTSMNVRVVKMTWNRNQSHNDLYIAYYKLNLQQKILLKLCIFSESPGVLSWPWVMLSLIFLSS